MTSRSAALVRLGLCLLPLALAAACGSGTSCTPPDAGATSCTVASMLVTCTNAEGGAQCLSNTDATCPGFTGTCQNKCASNEYAATCDGPPEPFSDGGFSDPSIAPPSSACQGLGVTPGGTESYCCPCGG